MFAQAQLFQSEAELIGDSGIENIRIVYLTCEAKREFVQNAMVGICQHIKLLILALPLALELPKYWRTWDSANT